MLQLIAFWGLGEGELLVVWLVDHIGQLNIVKTQSSHNNLCSVAYVGLRFYHISTWPIKQKHNYCYLKL